MPRKFRLSEYVKRKRMNTSSEPRQKKARLQEKDLNTVSKENDSRTVVNNSTKWTSSPSRQGKTFFTYCPDVREDIFIYFSYLEENYRKSKISSENFCVSKLLRTLVATPT